MIIKGLWNGGLHRFVAHIANWANFFRVTDTDDEESSYTAELDNPIRVKSTLNKSGFSLNAANFMLSQNAEYRNKFVNFATSSTDYASLNMTVDTVAEALRWINSDGRPNMRKDDAYRIAFDSVKSPMGKDIRITPAQAGVIRDIKPNPTQRTPFVRRDKDHLFPVAAAASFHTAIANDDLTSKESKSRIISRAIQRGYYYATQQDSAYNIDYEAFVGNPLTFFDYPTAGLLKHLEAITQQFFNDKLEQEYTNIPGKDFSPADNYLKYTRQHSYSRKYDIVYHFKPTPRIGTNWTDRGRYVHDTGITANRLYAILTAMNNNIPFIDTYFKRVYPLRPVRYALEQKLDNLFKRTDDTKRKLNVRTNSTDLRQAKQLQQKVQDVLRIAEGKPNSNGTYYADANKSHLDNIKLDIRYCLACGLIPLTKVLRATTAARKAYWGYSVHPFIATGWLVSQLVIDIILNPERGGYSIHSGNIGNAVGK